jgi:hypothetical protein
VARCCDRFCDDALAVEHVAFVWVANAGRSALAQTWSFEVRCIPALSLNAAISNPSAPMIAKRPMQIPAIRAAVPRMNSALDVNPRHGRIVNGKREFPLQSAIIPPHSPNVIRASSL